MRNLKLPNNLRFILKRNSEGEIIFGKPEKLKEEYEFETENDFVDKYGFDKKFIMSNGSYKIDFEMKPGQKLVRYGSNKGHFLADYGATYDMVALPYKEKTVQMHCYVVIKSFHTTYGKIYPQFFSKEKGINTAMQYYVSLTIYELLRDGYIKEISCNFKRN